MKKCIILQGVSGSGKSTYVKKLEEEYPGVLVVVSADHYFTKEGNYGFDPTKLGEAHAECLKSFRYAVDPPELYFEHDSLCYDRRCECTYDGYEPPAPAEVVVVDNTNCSAIEIAPYLTLAQAYGYEVHIHRVKCELADAIERAEKGPHKTPAKAVLGQWRTLKCYDPPPWWPQVEVVG